MRSHPLIGLIGRIPGSKPCAPHNHQRGAAEHARPQAPQAPTALSRAAIEARTAERLRCAEIWACGIVTSELRLALDLVSSGARVGLAERQLRKTARKRAIVSARTTGVWPDRRSMLSHASALYRQATGSESQGR